MRWLSDKYHTREQSHVRRWVGLRRSRRDRKKAHTHTYTNTKATLFVPHNDIDLLDKIYFSGGKKKSHFQIKFHRTDNYETKTYDHEVIKLSLFFPSVTTLSLSNSVFLSFSLSVFCLTHSLSLSLSLSLSVFLSLSLSSAILISSVNVIK